MELESVHLKEEEKKFWKINLDLAYVPQKSSWFPDTLLLGEAPHFSWLPFFNLRLFNVIF